MNIEKHARRRLIGLSVLLLPLLVIALLVAFSASLSGEVDASALGRAGAGMQGGPRLPHGSSAPNASGGILGAPRDNSRPAPANLAQYNARPQELPGPLQLAFTGTVTVPAPAQPPPGGEESSQDAPPPTLTPQSGAIYTSIKSPRSKDSLRAPARPEAVLYDQYNSVSDEATNSQQFAGDKTGRQVADDFVVPVATYWQVDMVEVAGDYGLNGGPASTVNVFFYEDNGTLPGTVVYSMTNQPVTAPFPSSGDLTINLTNPAILGPGTYWISVQPKMSYQPMGQWFWHDRTVQSNDKAAFRDPDAFDTDCPDWGVREVCVGGTGHPDQVFRLSGTSSLVPPGATSSPTSTNTPTATPTITCLRTWEIIPSENITPENRLMSVDALTPTDVWAVGYYIDPSTLRYRTLIHHWNGSQWLKVISPNQGTGDNQLRGVKAIAANNVWAVGSYKDDEGNTRNLILHYNGSTWAVQSGVPDPGVNNPALGYTIATELYAVDASGPTDVWAVGRYRTHQGASSNGKRDLTLALHYDGSTWSHVSSPNPHVDDSGSIHNVLYGVDVRAPNDVWAVGEYFTLVGSAFEPSFFHRTLVLHYTGTWTIVKMEDSSSRNTLHDVAAVAADDVWVVGHANWNLEGDYYDARAMIRHWDGSTWTRADLPDIDTSSSYLYSIDAAAPDNVWAVGLYERKYPVDDGFFDYVYEPLVLHWDGNVWRQLDAATDGTRTDSYFYGVAAAAADSIWTVGTSGRSEFDEGFASNESYRGDKTLVQRYSGPCVEPSDTPTSTTTAEATETEIPESTFTPVTDEPEQVPYCVFAIPTAERRFTGLLGIDGSAAATPWAVGYATDEINFEPGGFTREGEPITVYWTGQKWLDSPSARFGYEDDYLVDVAVVAPDDVWAVGAYYNGGIGDSAYQSLVTHWNGTFWEFVDVPNWGFGNNYLFNVTAISADDIWAVGKYINSDGREETIVMHYGGPDDHWVLRTGPGLGLLEDVDHSATNNVWATGSLTARYNGTAWNIDPGAPQDASDIVAITGSDVWAVQYRKAYHWNGSGWTAHDLPVPAEWGEYIFAFANGISASSSNDVWVVGYGVGFFPPAMPWVVHWNGSEWGLIDPPLYRDDGSTELTEVLAISPTEVWAIIHWRGSSINQEFATVRLGQECPQAGTCGPNSNYAIATATATIEPGGVDIGNHCQACNTVIDLPFPITLYGNDYLTATLGSGGFMQFDSNAIPYIGQCLPVDRVRTTIFGHWGSADTSPIEGDGIFTSTLGTAPNRTFYVEWRAHWFGDEDYPVNFEMRFFEGQDKFEIVYGNVYGNGEMGVVGVQNSSGSLYTEYECREEDTLSPGLLLIFSQPECAVETATPTRTVTRTATRTATRTSTPTRTATRTATATMCVTCIATNTAISTATSPPTNTVTRTATSAPTNTATRTAISTRTATRTAISTSTNTAISTATGTATGTATATRTAISTSTNTAISTATGTAMTSPSVIVPTTTSTRVPATATKTNTAVVTPTCGRFPDVEPGSTFYDYITCLGCKGVVTGFSDGLYRPGLPVTRGQITKMVSNAAGFSEDPGEQIYADVPPGSTFYVWINRLTNRGIVGGYPCPTRPDGGEGGDECTPENPNIFKPNENATRGQLAKIVSNAAGFSEAVSGQHYADVPPTGEGSQFYEWIMRLTNRDVMGGYPCGTSDSRSGPCDGQNRPYFRPADTVTRGQAAKIMANTFFPNCQAQASQQASEKK